MWTLEAGLLAELAGLVGPGQVSTEPGELAAHARDCWPRLMMRERAGEDLPRPAAVVWPVHTEEAAALYRWASRRHVALVPFGGGGGVVGGAAPVPGCVAVDTKRMNRIVGLDELSGHVVVQPGVIGQNLEEWLGPRGWTLGHFPSSITLSSVGGFAAARSAGQLSTKYGTFPAMVAGVEAVLPDGSVVRRRAQPASAAGPDLTGLLLGAEGTLGLLTELTLRVHPKPEVMAFAGYALPSFPAGLAVLRALLRRGLRPAVLRLYDDTETRANHADETAEGCLLVAVCEGWSELVALEDRAVRETVAAHGGTDLGEGPARRWHAHRYDVSYRLADIIKPGGVFGDAVAVDTCEVAAPWGRLQPTYEAVRSALGAHMDLVLCHASHAYPDGAALYFTFGAAGGAAAAAAGHDGGGLGEAEVRVCERYDAAWAGALDATVAAGATISHHHGVGVLRAPWLAAELGAGGMAMLRQVKAALDPAGIANPGKLGLAPEVPA
ncbi:MAG TPA: FAD-binding oxidoreductase [Egibacteraceae bacterium]|nr:FAD-binding oxidoreductase [Egibacteraceae bacterium]